MKTLRNPSQFFEKEYYFDEKLGVSLSDHIDDIKKNFPDVEVQTRRDRDGFAIVKTKYKPNYKYKLDSIINLNEKEEKQIMKESMEAVLKEAFPEGVEQVCKSPTHEKISELINLMTFKDQEMDLESRKKVDALINKRLKGNYKNDINAFVYDYIKLSQEVEISKNAKPFYMIDYVKKEREEQ